MKISSEAIISYQHNEIESLRAQLQARPRLTAEEQNAIERAIVCMSDPEFFHQSEPLKNAVVVLSKMLEE